MAVSVTKERAPAASVHLREPFARGPKAELDVPGAVVLASAAPPSEGLSRDGLRTEVAGEGDSSDGLAAEIAGEDVDVSSGPVPDVRDVPAAKRDPARVCVAAVGPASLVELLGASGGASGGASTAAFAIQHFPRPSSAAQHLRACHVLPDVIVIDADQPGAVLLAEELLGESPTDEIPLVVLGRFSAPEHAARFVALGAARCFAKPVSAAELHRACRELSPDALRGAAMPLGAMTIDVLSDRLANELAMGLSGAVEHGVRHERVELGEGSELLTLVWDAVARVRELITAQTNGAVRFRRDVRAEALAVGTAVTRTSEREEQDRLAGRGEVRSVAHGALAGVTALVAVEDLATNWFLAGVLRDAGATVFDAFSGADALDRAVRHVPDVVIADVLLAELDGGSLARALADDVILRDTPVLLVADGSERLRRVRELGVARDGVLLKDASGKTVLRRVLELLRPRQGLLARLATSASVQGRLGDLLPLTMLRVVRRARVDARVFFHTGEQVFEIDLCAGAPVRACRTAPDGTVARGVSALAELMGARDGRFRVERPTGTVCFELTGSLEELLAEPVARARAAHSLTTGSSLMRAETVVLDAPLLRPLLAVTPEPERSVLAALLNGASPRQLVESARFAADAVACVLADAARREAIVAVYDVTGDECLTATTARELLRIRGDVVQPAPVRAPIVPGPRADSPRREDIVASPIPASNPSEPAGISAPPAVAPAIVVPSKHFIVPPSDLVAELDASPIQDLETLARPTVTPILASRRTELARAARQHELPLDAGLDALLAEAPDAQVPELKGPGLSRAVRRPAPLRVPLPAASDACSSAPLATVEHEPMPRFAMPSSYAARPTAAAPPARPSAWSRFAGPAFFAIAGIALALGARSGRFQRSQDGEPAPVVAVAAPLSPAPAPAEPAGDPLLDAAHLAPAAETSDGAAVEASSDDVPGEAALSAKELVAAGAGKGVIEIVAGRKDEIFVDGKSLGFGPSKRIAVTADGQRHEVRVKLRGEDRVRYVVAKEGVRIRVRVAPPWSN
ncbi:MAG: response regulator [Myxococcales bacterium]|nr:response regulator [Myxococcales bacterium]